MKTQHFFWRLAVIAVLFTGCNTDTDVDYRSKWVGSYECVKENSHARQVKVDVIAKEDSLLNITEENLQEGFHGIKHDVKVNSDGSFKRIPNEHESIKPHVDGCFYKDSIYVLYIYPAPGTTVSFDYKGKKLKKK
jgi:hypothetical protein